MKNPNCDNDKCTSETGEVRVLPTGGDSNAILCHACFNHEISFRKERNRDLSQDCRFRLPSWDSLKVYGEEKPAPVRFLFKPNWKMSCDQIYFSEWEKRDVLVKFAGPCAVCQSRTYSPCSEDGRPYDPDPRGMFVPEHASAHLVASEYSMSGPDVVLCFECSNTREKYERGLAIARGQWKAVEHTTA